CRKRNREASLLGDVVCNNRRADLIHLQAAVLLRNIDRGQAKFTGLLDKAARNREILRLNLIRDRDDLIQGKLCRRLRDLAMLFGEVLGEKAVGRRCIRYKEPSARDDLLVGRNWGRYGSHYLPRISTNSSQF